MGYAMPEVGMAARRRREPRVRERAPAYAAAPGPSALAPDSLDELADEIRVLAAHLHAGTRELLGLIARFDAAGGWKPGGHVGCENWLSLNTGVALRVAREYVRVARALEELPETGASMGRGALSLCQVRALTRVATSDTEADLLTLAEGASTAVLEREFRAWKTLGRKDEAERERALHASRRLALYPNGDGMHRLDALLMPEVAATFGKAIDRARFALYRNRGEAEWSDDPAEISRQRADAFGLVAEWALAFNSGSGSGEDDEDDPISGTRAERFQVMLHVEPATLAADGEPGRSELEDGTRLAAETARRLACDCGLVRVERGPGGEVLNIGRKSRSLPSALRRALELRDRGCRFPGCGLRFTDGHHLVHWADGGETSLRNTMLLCRVHHRLVHEGGWTVQWWGRHRDRHPVFLDPRGQAHGSFRPPPSPVPDDPAGALARRNRARGARPDADTAPARWHHERDIPDEVLFRALEATAPG
jgi:hypothetical protein